MAVWQCGPKAISGYALVMRWAVFGVFLAWAGGAGAAPFDLSPQSNTTLALEPVPQSEAAAQAYRADDHCMTFRDDPGPRSRQPLAADDWACSRPVPAPPREWKLQRGEAWVSLGIANGGERSAGAARGTFAVDHSLGLGFLGGWQFHADIQINQGGSAQSVFALGKTTHISLTHGLPAGWTLRLTANGAMQGAPTGARTVEIAATLSHSFRMEWFDGEHRVSLAAADQILANCPYGAEEQKTVANLDYAHTFASGSVGANLGVSRLEMAGVSPQNAARAEVKFSRRF